MKYIVVLYLLVQTCNYLYCKEDTLSVNLKNIKIEADKVSDLQKVYGLNSEHIFIDKSQDKAISDYLKLIPGVFIKDYGGLGGIKSISMRGTNSNQTIICLNEIPINNTNNPSFDLSEIPISCINSIDVIKSGTSANYGSGGIGGAINLQINGLSKSQRLSSSISLGSFHSFLGSFATNFGNLEKPFKLFVDFQYSKGDYPFEFNNFGNNIDTFRLNSQIHKITLGFQKSFSLSNYYFSLLTFANYNEQGVPGAVVLGNIENSIAYLKQLSIYLLPNFVFINTPNSLFKLNNLLKYKKMEVLDFKNSFLSNEDNYLFNSFDLKSYLIYQQVSNNTQINYEAGAEVSSLNGNFLQPALSGSASRNNFFIATSLLQNKLFDVNLLDIETNVRMDYFTDDNNLPFTFFIGSNYQIESISTIVHLDLSKNFRIPSFDEMYYLNYGNTNLKPENSYSCDFSLSKNLQKWINFKANVYYTITNDQIVAVPKSVLTWSAENIGKVQNYGIEWVLKALIDGNTLNADISYTYQNCKDLTENSPNYGKYIPYIPQEIISANLTLNIDDFSILTNYYYNSYRYYMPDNSLSSLLPSYFTLDVSVNYRLKLKANNLNFKLSANNLLNENYQIIRNFPMPGRNFLFSINYEMEN
jgi:outer membrane cobalamin receptor